MPYARFSLIDMLAPLIWRSIRAIGIVIRLALENQGKDSAVKSCLRGLASRVGVLLIMVAAFWGVTLPLSAQSYGMDQRSAVGPFLNNPFP